MILVLSHKEDEHAAAVLNELSAAGHPAELFDTADFPRHASVIEQFDNSGSSFALLCHGRSICLDDCRAAWWRRPQAFTLHEGLAADTAAFAYGECHEAISGLWPSLPAQWVNAPEFDTAAHHKPYQLKVAAQAGLHIPRTLITNDPDTARQWISDVGSRGTIYKTFLASEQCWRETRVIQQHELELLDTLKLAPVIFQEYIPATSDLRVTMIGPHLFAAAITAPRDGYEVDYRMDMPAARFEPTNLPEEITNKLYDLMQRLGLTYGAIDLRRTPDGKYVFLEVNPAGEWLFVEERTAQPITAAVAGYLAQLDRGESPTPKSRRKPYRIRYHAIESEARP